MKRGPPAISAPHCRRSTIYRALARRILYPILCDHPAEQLDTLVTDVGIFSPGDHALNLLVVLATERAEPFRSGLAVVLGWCA